MQKFHCKVTKIISITKFLLGGVGEKIIFKAYIKNLNFPFKSKIFAFTKTTRLNSWNIPRLVSWPVRIITFYAMIFNEVLS